MRNRTRHVLELRREALNKITQRLIEVESIDSEELTEIIESASRGPVLSPGTTSSMPVSEAAPEAKKPAQSDDDSTARGAGA